MVNLQSERLKGVFALFGAALIYASFGLLIRTMEKMYGDYSQVAIRFALAFVVIYFLNKFRRGTQLAQLDRASKLKSLILGLTFGAVVLFFTLSVTNTKIANTVFVFYGTSMISSLLIGTFALKEKLSVQKVIALVVAFVGLVMYSNAILTLSFGIITGVIAGFFDGISNAIRKTLQGIDRRSILQFQFFGSALLASIAMFFSSEPLIKNVSLLPVLVTVVFALLQIKLGDWLLYGFQRFDVNTGTIILATELLFASLVGLLFFRETLSQKELLGGILIFAASITSAIEFKSRKLMPKTV